MTARVTVFLDYQNVYSSARRAFHSPLDPASSGHVRPTALAELLVAKRAARYESELRNVRVYRGLPDSDRQPRSYGANRAQEAAWRSDPRCEVIQRPLRYPRDWPESGAEEKGIDVQIALDVVMGAQRGAFDVAILFSTDTDLRPALEEVMRLNDDTDGPFPWVEVAAWSAEGQHSPRLSVPRRKVWCHYLTKGEYVQVADPTVYVRRGRGGAGRR